MDSGFVLLIPLSFFDDAVNDSRRSVVAMVVHDNQVECERRLLFQHTEYGVFYRANAIAHRNDDRSLDGEFVLVEFYLVELIGSQQRTDSLEVSRACAFHFNLTCAVTRVDVVKLLLA